MREQLLWIATAGYLTVALASKLFYTQRLGPIKVLPLLYALLFTASIAVGTNVPWKLKKARKAFLVASVVILFLIGPTYFLAGVLSYTLFILYIRVHPKVNLPTIILLLSVISLMVAVYHGVPLLRPELRHRESVFYFVSAYMAVLGLSFSPNFWLFTVGMTSAILATYRNLGIVVASAYTLRLLIERNMRLEKREVAILAVIALLILAVFVVRYQATVRNYETWRLSFLGTLFYRPGTTYTIYERLFNLGFPFGKAKLLFMSDPTGYVGRVFGKSVGYTYTIFGQPVYDFGVLGLLEGFLLGFAFKQASKNISTFVLAGSLSIVFIALGINGFYLALMFFLVFVEREVGKWEEIIRSCSP